MTKTNLMRWAVATKKNVILEPTENWHTSFSFVQTFKPFKTFKTRTDARNFKKTMKTPAVIIDTHNRLAVR